MENTVLKEPTTKTRDIRQEVTDIIIRQLEQGTVPWHQPWIGNDSNKRLGFPRNAVTANHYRGINIVLLWGASLQNGYTSSEWGSFKQWNQKKEVIRKGEKGSLIVYYDTMEKEIEGEVQKIPFLKSSVVFNRCQLASFDENEQEELPEQVSLIERIEVVDKFVANTEAVIEHKGDEAFYIPSQDKITLPYVEYFKTTDTCTAAEGYYSTILHELIHWTGDKKRLDRLTRIKAQRQNYAIEELVAEFGSAFLCAGFGIATVDKGNHASYIDYWLKFLKGNKNCLFTASGEASRAVDYLYSIK